MLTAVKKVKSIIFAFTLLFFSFPALAANTTIDILVVYTKGVADAYGGDPSTRINQLFQFTNMIYSDSNVGLEIRVADTMMVNYTDDNDGETALEDITFARNDAFKDVAMKRESVNADMVILYRPFKSVQGSCGQAWIGELDSEGHFTKAQNKNYMYSHIPINGCGDFVTAHELGHNMGLKHSRQQDGEGGVFHYALGYGVLNKFATIMAYQTSFNVDYWTGKVYKFSNPELTCRGEPCGIDRNDKVNGADAAFALNITTPQLASFFGDEISSASSSSTSSRSSNTSSSSTTSSNPASIRTSAASSSQDAHLMTNGGNDNNQSGTNNLKSSGGGSINTYSLFCLLLLLTFRRQSAKK